MKKIIIILTILNFCLYSKFEASTSGQKKLLSANTLTPITFMTTTIKPTDTSKTTFNLTNNAPDYSRISLANTNLNEGGLSEETSTVHQEQFTEIILPFSGVTTFSVAAAWGDYDDDNDLDIAIIGISTQPSEQKTKIFRNDDGVFVDIEPQLIGVGGGGVAWGDYDNDGDLDLLLSGGKNLTDGATKIYRNDNCKFNDINAQIMDFERSSIDWGDYDNDGDLDFIICGAVLPYGIFTRIYKNEGSNIFNEIVAGLPGFFLGTVSWIDYDNNGDLDIFLSGKIESNTTSYVTKIYQNEQGIYKDISATLEQVSFSDADWGDYDNDGDLDLALTGSLYTSALNKGFSEIYENENGNFKATSSSLLPVTDGSIAWGDYNNDNLLDILLSGSVNRDSNITFIYPNNNLGFGDPIKLSNKYSGDVNWGDFNNDKKLDVLLASNPIRIYQNNTNNTKNLPSIPINLSSQTDEKTVTFIWNDGAIANVRGSYNLRVGTYPGGVDILSPMSDNSGYHKIPQIGNAGFRTTKTLKNLPEGNYYYSVQSIDNAYLASAFSEEKTFTIVLTSENKPPIVNNPIPDIVMVLNRDSSTWNLKTTPSTFTDPDGDKLSYYITVDDTSIVSASINDVTLMVLSKNKGETNLTITANDGRGGQAKTTFIVTVITLGIKPNFTEIPISLARAKGGTCTWVDYDNDADLDIFLMGWNYPEGEITQIYKNNIGDFTNINLNLSKLYLPKADWGDYDNDGDLDIIICGGSGSNRITKIYRNDFGVFNDSHISLIPVRYGTVTWGDYDNDGDLDILYSGHNTTSSKVTKLYRNDKDTFSDTFTDFVNVSNSSIVWGDYDNDNDLDILISGEDGQGMPTTKLYRNDQANFIKTDVSLTGVSNGNNSFIDYDNDGDLDIFLAGYSTNKKITYSFKIYRNNNSTFTDINVQLATVTSAGVDWGDYDNDGDLDIALVGYHSVGTTYIATIYENYEGVFIDTYTDLTGMIRPSVDWGDYDNDGDLDLLVSGSNYLLAYGTKIYRNELNDPNTPPKPPEGLHTLVMENELTFNWEKSEDAETYQNALTYNLRVGTTPGGQEIMSAMVDPDSNYMLIPESGNVNHNTSWQLKNVHSNQVYWSVQTIDNGYSTSEFAPEQEVDLITAVKNNDVIPLQFELLQNYPNPFNPSTMISYVIPNKMSNQNIKLEIYNNLGQKIKTMVNTKQSTGHYKIKWNGDSDRNIKLTSGIYIYRLVVGTKVVIKKMLLLK